MLQLSFSTGTLYHLPLRVVFRLAREAGFDGVELVLGPETLIRGADYVRRLTREYALPVLSLHPPIVPWPGLDSPVSSLPRLTTLADQLGCGLVVLHPPKVVSRETKAWTEFVQALGRPESDSPVRISVENPAIFRASDSDYVLHDLQRLLVFADQYDLPLTFDTAHAGTASVSLLQAYDMVWRRVVNVHFSDLVRRSITPDWPPLYTFFLHHQMPGAGELPLAQFVLQLVKGGYSGTLTVEVSPTAIQAWSVKRIREGMAASITFIREAEKALAGSTA